MRLWLLLFFILSWAANSQATYDAPQSFTIDGYLYQAGTTTPLDDSAAQMRIQILNASKTCLLYEELQTVNTSATSGYFNIQVGSAVGSTKRTSNDVGLTMIQIFQNATAVTAGNVSGSSCTGSTYTPTAGDVRYFRITVTPSASNVADTLSPDAVVGSVPNAMVAQSLEGIERANILQANSSGSTVLTQTNLNALFTSPGYGYLQSILSGNFMATTSSGADLPVLTTTPSTPSTGNIWYDSSSNTVKYYNGSAVETLGTAGSGMTSVSVSSNLTLNGTVGGTSTSTATIDLASTGTAGTYYKVTTDAQGRVTSGTTSLVATDIPALGYVPSAGGNMTGNLTFSSGIGTVYTDSSLHTLTLEAPTSASASYVMKLPTSVGTNGQFLSTDGAGDLLWSTPSTTATAYSGVLPVANGGTNNSALSGNQIMISSTSKISEAGPMTNGQILIGASGGAPSIATITAGSGISVVNGTGSITIAASGLQSSSLASGMIWVGQSTGTPSSVTPSGDVTLSTAGAFTNVGLRGVPLAAATPTSSGQVLRYSGSSWAPNFVSMADLRSTVTGATALNSCSANQTMTWSSAADNLTCSNIALPDSQISYSSKTANTFLAAPNGTNGTPSFRAIASSDLPSLASGFTGVLPASNGGTGLTSCPVNEMPAWSTATSTWVCAQPPVTDDAYGNLKAGTSALASNTNNSEYNIAIGDGSQQYMAPSVTLPANISFGYHALQGSTATSNDTGAYNIAIGYNAIESDTTGSDNIALGYQAMQTNSSGSSNTALGYQALMGNTIGSGNMALGSQALLANTTGGSNTALGSSALQNNTTGSDNMALGSGGMISNTTGSHNISLGLSAMASNTTGVYNIGIGYQTLYFNSQGSNNIAIGYESQQYVEASTSGNNVSVGYLALQGGASAPASNTGANNVAMGSQALSSNTSGTGNVAIGSLAGVTATAADANTTGSNNVYIGYETGATSGTIDNVVVVGANASVGGNQAIAVGPGATASASAAISLGTGVATGQNSIAIGPSTNTAGSNSVAIGNDAVTLAAASNSVALGYGTVASNPNTIILGTSSMMVGIGTTAPTYPLQVNGDIDSSTGYRINGTSLCTLSGCTSSSDRRLKENIQPLTHSFENIMKLQGVSYSWIDKEKFGKEPQVGLIAQDLEKVYPEVVRTDSKTGYKSVAYDHLVAPLIEAFKVLNAKVESLIKSSDKNTLEMASLKKENEDLKKRVDRLEKILEEKSSNTK